MRSPHSTVSKYWSRNFCRVTSSANLSLFLTRAVSKGAKLAALQRKVQEMADGNRDSKIRAMATGMGVKLMS